MNRTNEPDDAKQPTLAQLFDHIAALEARVSELERTFVRSGAWFAEVNAKARVNDSRRALEAAERHLARTIADREANPRSGMAMIAQANAEDIVARARAALAGAERLLARMRPASAVREAHGA